MKFLFRAPLLDFDPQDEKKIVENWERVLKIISVSSTSLFDEISHSTYSSLHPKLKKKVYKYILRGRYRSTPFGLLAAVGLGEFNDMHNYNIDLLNINPIPQSTVKSISAKSEKSCFYLSYKAIDFELFKELFEDPTNNSAEVIWNMLLELGIINSVEFATSSKSFAKPKTDMVFTDEISLPPQILTVLREFYNQAGSMFCKSENRFLNSFKDWFMDKFDDRFIPLTVLIQYDDFLSKVFLKRREHTAERSISPEFNLELSSLKSLDLKPLFPQKPLDPGIFDLQLAFKTGTASTSIILENVVCNRPFVYYGRFNRDEKLYCQQKTTRDSIYQNIETY